MLRSQKGLGLIEVLVSVGIVGVLIFATLTVTSAALTQSRSNIDKQFATQKAISMLEELKSVVQSQTADNASLLDSYDDGVINRVVLTTNRAITDAGQPISGNQGNASSGWIWERRISVEKLGTLQSNDVRLVRVKVYKNDIGGKRLVSEVASVIRTIATNMPESQVYDVYCLAIENVPGWWVYMSNILPFVQGSISNLEARNPGLVFRTHFITRLSYGRDPHYTPYINRALDSNQPINNVYFYPGRMPAGSADDFYYPPDSIQGQVRIDALPIANGFNATTNPVPYTLADQYNNGMRYPDELAMYQARVAAVDATGARIYPSEEMTLRLLFDDMYMNPTRYTNAIVINLHGELFPFPATRNYSDAAKDPATFGGGIQDLRNVRVVTHPQRLRYTNAEDLVLRVYSYRTDPGVGGNSNWLGEVGNIPIQVTLKGINWVPAVGVGDIVAIRGGVNQDPVGVALDDYNTISLPGFNALKPETMHYTAAIVANPDGTTDTVLSLFNSPLKSPCVEVGVLQVTCDADDRGLSQSKRLYGFEYIPSPMEDFTGGAPPAAFGLNLSVTGGDVTKNTARWVITVPAAILNNGTNLAVTNNRIIAVETRIGADNTTGTRVNKPLNLSRTFAWRGTDNWVFGNAAAVPVLYPNLPLTEKYQLNGDPRHCPYEDLKRPHAGSGLAGANALGLGFNPYFDDFHAGANDRAAAGWWSGWRYTIGARNYGIKGNDGNDVNDGFDTGAGLVDTDFHRMFEVYRTAMLKPNAVFTSMTGFSFYYFGLGNEIGYDAANTFPNSIPVSNRPFTGGGGGRFEQTILSNGPPAADPLGYGTRYIREHGLAWWGMPWLGELFPDSEYSAGANWAVNGNLPTPNGAAAPQAGRFVRSGRFNFAGNEPSGTNLLQSVRRNEAEGCTTFFWIGNTAAPVPTSTFHHQGGGTTSTRTAAGADIGTNYNFPVPPSIDTGRPWDIDDNDPGENPESFLFPSLPLGMTSAIQRQYFLADSGPTQGSALLWIREPGTNNPAWFVINGLSPTGISGTAFIARWSFLTLIESYLSGSLYPNNATVNDARRVRMLPRVSITSPNDTTDLSDVQTLPITWSSTWRRWDNRPYTTAASHAAYVEAGVTVNFTTMYSRDNGLTWLHMVDEAPATPGTRPTNAAHLRTATNYTWNTPTATFPEGNYLIRIESYRDNYPLHYSFHQFRAFIKR